MKNLIVASFALLLSTAAFAEGMGVGYDQGLGMLMGRMAMGENSLDVGLGFDYDDTAAEKTAFGLAGFYNMPLSKFVPSFQKDEKFNVNTFIGGVFGTPHAKKSKTIAVSGGLQPEYFVHPKIALETRLGLNLNLVEDLKISTYGNGISIVSGVAFKVYF